MKKFFKVLFTTFLIFFIFNFFAISADADEIVSQPNIIVTAETGEYTNKNLQLAIVVDSEIELRTIKYKSGIKKLKYFKNSGKELEISDNCAAVKIKKNGNYTFYAEDVEGNANIYAVSITNIDKTAPTINQFYYIESGIADIFFTVNDENSGILDVYYLKGEYDINDKAWKSAKSINGKKSFEVDEGGIYTILAVDKVGNKAVSTFDVTIDAKIDLDNIHNILDNDNDGDTDNNNVISNSDEMKAVWITYLEFEKKKYTYSAFKTRIDTMFDNVVNLNMNTVIVQVRPFGDAFYNSSYFPWSAYIGGRQGIDPGFDPLEYMIEAAHARNLEFQAWINPYRVSLNNTNYSELSTKNYAYKWHNNSSTERNVISYNGSLYYNPSSSSVRNLIVNGVKEIVQNYDVDGIHFDDYFYPMLGNNYKSTFDANEYEEYVLQCNENGKSALSIANWRRNNINKLVKDVYSTIKEINPNVVFGISPAGEITNLRNEKGYYVDVDTWLSNSGYVDYICPQIYWSFNHPTAAFDKILNQWINIRKNKDIDLYVGIAVYKAGYSISGDTDWKNKGNVLASEIKYSRNTNQVKGFGFYRYASFYNSVAKTEIKNLMNIL